MAAPLLPPHHLTARLGLRAVGPDDVDLLVALDADEEVMRHLTGRASTREEVEAAAEASLGTRWLVFEREGSDVDDGFAGWVSAAPGPSGVELGWRLLRRTWGRGYATEAAGALVDAAFDAGADRVFAQTMAVNDRSRAVMARLGLRHVRTFHVAFDDPLPGTEHGEVEYELTSADWFQRRR